MPALAWSSSSWAGAKWSPCSSANRDGVRVELRADGVDHAEGPAREWWPVEDGAQVAVGRRLEDAEAD